MTILVAGMLLGVAGSAHCAGMCGPLLLVVMGGANSSRQAAGRAALIYHSCRISTYVVLAVPAGYAGRAMVLAGLGRVIAVVAGALLLLAATGSGQRWMRPVSLAWSTVVICLGMKARTFTRQSPHLGYAVLGLVNGLIPCGLVYAALATAAAVGSLAGSALFMSGFGLGTVPALLGVTIAAASVPVPLRERLRFVGPALMVFAGLLLIARGVMPADPAVHHHGSNVSIRDAGLGVVSHP
jgi:sulfite exporter TauE/SafE